MVGIFSSVSVFFASISQYPDEDVVFPDPALKIDNLGLVKKRTQLALLNKNTWPREQKIRCSCSSFFLLPPFFCICLSWPTEICLIQSSPMDGMIIQTYILTHSLHHLYIQISKASKTLSPFWALSAGKSN
jgi:hypothetical protein